MARADSAAEVPEPTRVAEFGRLSPGALAKVLGYHVAQAAVTAAAAAEPMERELRERLSQAEHAVLVELLRKVAGP